MFKNKLKNLTQTAQKLTAIHQQNTQGQFSATPDPPPQSSDILGQSTLRRIGPGSSLYGSQAVIQLMGKKGQQKLITIPAQ